MMYRDPTFGIDQMQSTRRQGDLSRSGGAGRSLAVT